MLTNYVSSSLVACFTASWECSKEDRGRAMKAMVGQSKK